MRRQIIGFHQDHEASWVAELDCLHGQHVRHRPPFQVRECVTAELEREARTGTELDCPLCDRAEPPDRLVVSRNAGPFDEETVPTGLCRSHHMPARTWGQLRVLGGSVGFSMRTDPVSNANSQPVDPTSGPPQGPSRRTGPAGSRLPNPSNRQ